MAIPEDPSADYVNMVTNNKYTTQTSDAVGFFNLKDMLTVYINSDTNYFPEKKQIHALALLVAHSYALNDTITPDAGGSDIQKGSVSSESVGDVSISYSGGPSTDSVDGWKAWLSQTVYGVQYLYLMKTFKPSPLVL